MGFGRSKGPQRITNSSEIALDGLLLGGRTLPLGVPVFLISVRRLPAPPQPPQQTKEHRVWPMAGPIQLTIRNLKTWLPFCLRRCPPQPCERDHRRKKLNLRKFSLHSTKKARLPTECPKNHGSGNFLFSLTINLCPDWVVRARDTQKLRLCHLSQRDTGQS